MSVDVIKARIMTVMRNLPPLPAVTRQLLAVLRDENSCADDVTKVLSSDQALAGKVLKLVNSSFYGVPKEVTTITRAVVILGFNGVRNLALGFGSMEALKKMEGTMNMNEFWSHALANGAAAQSLAPHVSRRTDPEEAFIAGLMHDIGAYVLAAAVPEAYAEVMKAKGGDRLALERDATGLTHAQVGQGLLQFWELPEAFANAARYHHDMSVAGGAEQPLTSLVALADVLACIHGGSFESPASEADLAKLMSATGVSIDNLTEALKNMGSKIGDMEEFMKIAGTCAADPVGNAAAEGTTCAIITTDDDRRGWTEVMLDHFGYQVFPMESFFNQEAGCEKVGLVLVDYQCMTRQQIDQLLPFLASQQARVAMLSESELPEILAAFPALKFVFSRADVDTVLAPQPA